MSRNLVKLKKLVTSSLIQKYEVMIFILMSWQLKKRKALIVPLFKLKFGVRGNFRLLISNLNSKMQYQFEIVRKCHFSSLKSWCLAQHSLMNRLPWQQWMTYPHVFNSKRYYRWLPSNHISVMKTSWTVFEIFSKNPRNHFDDVRKSIWNRRGGGGGGEGILPYPSFEIDFSNRKSSPLCNTSR